MLHLDPEKLDRRLGELLDNERRRYERVLVLFGDCHPDMHHQETLPGVTRTEGINCPEILLGKDNYRALRKEGAFFLMPEWTVRWKEIFMDEMGLTSEVARQLMTEMHTRLIYLDTGVMPVPEKHLHAVAEFTGLHWEVIVVEPDRLLEAINTALEKLNDES